MLIENEAVKCSHVTLGEQSFDVGSFIGEREIVAILAYRHDDRGGLNVVVVIEDTVNIDVKLEHRGPYTMALA